MDQERHSCPAKYHYAIYRKDGRKAFINTHRQAIYDENGFPLRLVGTSLDVTGQKENERKIQHLNETLHLEVQLQLEKLREKDKQLQYQSRLIQMGKMLSMIAHQWRQPLSEINAILMHIGVRHSFKDFSEEFLTQKINECNKITSYMSNTISDFQNFFKPSKEKEVFEISEACQRSITILQASLKYHGIEFSFDISEKMEVYGYPNEFAQALLNILSNAKDVLSEREISNPFIRLYLKKGYKYILIVIEDNGGGISNEHMDRIFEPYFTTKYAKQGTGIGLYMTKMIIENNMGGIINVKNTNSGALFTIKLPSVPEQSV